MAVGEKGATGSPLTVIAVLTWNGYETTRACLETLASLRDWPLPVVVVDNGSREPEGERLAAAFGPPVSFLRLDPNRGVPGGYNAGIRRATELGASYVLLMNNDTMVTDPEMIARLTAAAGPGVAAVAPLTLDRDGRIYSAGGTLSWWTGLSGHRRHPERTDGPYEADWLDAPCLLVSVDAARRVGGLEEAFVTYWEDVDWCVRARRAGFRLLVEPGTSVIHLRGGANPRVEAEAMHLRNRLLFMRRNGGRLHNVVSAAFFLAVHVPVFLLRRGGDRARLRGALEAVSGAIRWNLDDAWRGRSWRRPASGPAIDGGPGAA